MASSASAATAASPIPAHFQTRRMIAPRLQILIRRAYIILVRVRPDYGDKRLRNKRTGPGGGTRRLHQGASRQKSEIRTLSDFRFLSSDFWREAPRWGRNRIDRRVKADLSLGMVSAVIGLIVQVPTITKWPSLPNQG